MEKTIKTHKKKKIWVVITFWMILVFLIVGASYLLVVNFWQYLASDRRSYDYVTNNVEDVSADMDDLAEASMLNMIERLYTTGTITTADIDDPEALSRLLQKVYSLDGMEVDLINADGVVLASSIPDMVGKEFQINMEDEDSLMLMDGSIYASYSELQPSINDASVLMQYARAKLPDDSGMIQIGFEESLYYKLIVERAQFSVTNRRIGETGYLLVCDKDQTIINSFHNEYTWKTLEDAGITIDPDQDYSMLTTIQSVFGEDSFVCINQVHGIFVVGVYPFNEAQGNMRMVMKILLLLEIVVFTALFIVLFVLIRRVIVYKIIQVNKSLEKITAGNLEEKVDVRRTYEFDLLSTDINQTVDRLKGYIAEAAARIDEDLENAKTIQSSALPKVFPPFPERNEFRLYASMTAAKEVGGDFYDYFMLPNHTLGFLIADVSGKSIPGAMFMMRSKSELRTLAQSGLSPAEVFNAANESLCEGNDSEMFVTVWMGYLDYLTGEVLVANAGHNRPLLIRDGRAKYINSRADLMLAGMEGTVYSEQRVVLKPGDTLFLYTDGVTEAMDPDLQQYGERRLMQLLSYGECAPEPDEINGMPGAICRLVAEDVNRFVRGAEQSDDITMLCIRYLGDGRS